MSEVHSLYFSIPVFNKHRLSNKVAIRFAFLQREDPERCKELLRAKRSAGPIRHEDLQEPDVYIALGKEASFAPPSPGSDKLAFVEKLLNHAAKDDRCSRLDSKCAEEIVFKAVELEAQEFYVFPHSYRPVTHIGLISKKVADTLVRSDPCASEESAEDPFREWKDQYSLRLAFREIQQVLLKVVSSGPFILSISQFAIAGGRDDVKTGSALIPVGVA